MAHSTGDPVHKFLIYSGKYEGVEAGEKQQKFSKLVLIDLAKVFSLQAL